VPCNPTSTPSEFLTLNKVAGLFIKFTQPCAIAQVNLRLNNRKRIGLFIGLRYSVRCAFSHCGVLRQNSENVTSGKILL